ARWMDVKERTQVEKKKYLEVTFEDLLKDSEAFTTEICEFCGLKNQFDHIPTIIPEKLNYWKKEMTSAEIAVAEDVLGPYIEMMGYE
ncbi:MAG: sulfotransferase, partial [bacterium]|nr:sulfotransferase [bacterium]